MYYGSGFDPSTYLAVVIIAGLINGIIFGLITRAIARNKGYSGGFWWGALLGAIGIIVVATRKNLRTANNFRQNRAYEAINDQNPLPPNENRLRPVNIVLVALPLTFWMIIFFFNLRFSWDNICLLSVLIMTGVYTLINLVKRRSVKGLAALPILCAALELILLIQWLFFSSSHGIFVIFYSSRFLLSTTAYILLAIWHFKGQKSLLKVVSALAIACIVLISLNEIIWFMMYRSYFQYISWTNWVSIVLSLAMMVLLYCQIILFCRACLKDAESVPVYEGP